QRAAIPLALTSYATRTPVPARTITGLAAAVQLRLRVAIGLQALQRCSGLLNRGARGSTVATHHLMPAWLSSDSSSFVNCRAIRLTGVRVSPSAPLHAPVAQIIRAGGFEPPGCRWDSCRECHFQLGMWFNPNSRGSRFRIWQSWGCKSLHAHQFNGAWPQRE